MSARPFTPEMGRVRRPVHGGTQALAGMAVLVTSAWAGAHGLGVVLGWVIVVAATAPLILAVPVAGAWAAGQVVQRHRARREVRG